MTAAVPTPPAWTGDAFDAALEAVLHTARLRLEPQCEAHADALFELLRDDRLYAHIPQEPPESLQALRERLAWLSGRRAPEGNALWLNWVVRGAADGAHIGRVQATVRCDAPAYLAYEVFPAHWHQGYATEACIRMIHWLIDELQIEHFMAEVDSLNDRFAAPARSVGLPARVVSRRGRSLQRPQQRRVDVPTDRGGLLAREPAMTQRIPPRALVLLPILWLVWGTNWPLFPLATREVSVWTFRAVSVLIAGAALLIAARVMGQSLAIPRRHWRTIAVATFFYLVVWNIASTYRRC